MATTSRDALLPFNSHPHKEDDENSDDIATSEELSTHILTRRMTLSGYAGNLDLDLSTHILTRRMTGAGAYWDLQTNPFNSHPHKEDDINWLA